MSPPAAVGTTITSTVSRTADEATREEHILEKLGKLHLNFAGSTATYGNFDTHFYKGQDEYSEDGVLRISPKYRAKAQYPDFLPTWDPKEKYPPLTFQKYDDPGLRADKELTHLFPKDAKIESKRITPKLGTEIKGIQLSQLSGEAKDELALFVAQRGVVLFKDQDFANHGPNFAVQYGKHFGNLHIHHTSGHPETAPELHVTYRRPDHSEFERVFEDSHTSIGWHTDVSYELQPPSYTFFSVLQGPEGGGDTLFADTVEAYERLSPPFRQFLESLHVIHSGVEQGQNSQVQGGVQRRPPTGHIHPLVRWHPVLKKKCLYVNRAFSRRIVELKKPESDLLLNFLYSLFSTALDLQLRAYWEPGTVAVWDNRRTLHSAVIDWEEPVNRHAFRITPHAERPVGGPEFYNDPNYFPQEVTQY